jgi:hypothetical protein
MDCGLNLSGVVTLCAILLGCIAFWAIVVLGVVVIT